MRLLKPSTVANVMVLMTDSSDHVTGKTGLTLTVTASKDGGTFGAISPTVTERGSGWYNIALTTAHTDTPGDLALHMTAAGADSCDVLARVQDIAQEVLTAASTAPIASNVQRVNDLVVDGAGTEADPWGPV